MTPLHREEPDPSARSGPATATRRPRVLVIAEAANPVLTSASLVGWSCAQAIRTVADVHIVTELRNRGDFLKAGMVEGTDFTAIDARASQGLAWRIATWLRGGKDLGWTTYAIFTTLAYPFFERSLLKHFLPALKRGDFDLVHRVLPLSPVTPSPIAPALAKLGIPFILGPLNGGVPWPKEFRHIAKKEKEWAGKLRPLARYLPAAKATRKYATAIIAGARSVWREVDPAHRDKTFFIPENAIDLDRFPYQERPASTGPLKVAFVGRLVPLKGVDMLIEAAAPLAKAGLLHLDIIGDGPERAELLRQAAQEGASEHIHLDGWVQHAQLHERLSQSHLFAFPSVREFGGGAVLEAMALGLPAVVLDHGGPVELVPPETGYILPMEEREMIVTRLRALFEQLVADPTPLQQKGRNARAHIERHYTWPAKARQIRHLYDWLLQRRDDKPAWQMPYPFERQKTPDLKTED